MSVLGPDDAAVWVTLNAFLDDPVMALGFSLALVSLVVGLVLTWVRKALR